MSRVGVAFDVDGVLLRGRAALEPGIRALELVREHHIPHIFITNGGGITEKSKALDLSKKLGHEVLEEQVILSHTPYRQLAASFATKNVLVIGHGRCSDLLRTYGFNKVITTYDILAKWPNIYPDNALLAFSNHRSATTDYDGSPISAVFVVHEPVDWAVDMQILTDILIDGQPAPHIEKEGSLRQTIPMFACNADLVYTAEHPRPRYTQGAFIDAFRHIFEKFTGSNLQVTFFGKPFRAQYDLAEELLREQIDASEKEHIEHYYGIGDNPASDIKGANDAGAHWSSILVRTGVFQGKGNDETHPADVVVEDVFEAVRFIVQKHILN